jgi:hypothetical protein
MADANTSQLDCDVEADCVAVEDDDDVVENPQPADTVALPEDLGFKPHASNPTKKCEQMGVKHREGSLMAKSGTDVNPQVVSAGSLNIRAQVLGISENNNNNNARGEIPSGNQSSGVEQK